MSTATAEVTNLETTVAENGKAEAVTVEALLRLIQQLPRAEQIRLVHLIENRHSNPNKPPLDKRVPALPMPDDKRERQWVEEHKHEYPGYWVALDGDRLIAASLVQQEVHDATKNDSAYLPLIIRVPSPDDLPFIGV